MEETAKFLIYNADAPDENPDGIGIEGAMKYLESIQVKLDEVVCLAISELLQSPSMGEFTRENFVNGWKDAKYTTPHSIYTYNTERCLLIQNY